MKDMELRDFARVGAELQLRHIYETFPELRPTTETARQPDAAPAPLMRRRAAWSPETRRRVSARMKRRWKMRKAAGFSKLGA